MKMVDIDKLTQSSKSGGYGIRRIDNLVPDGPSILNSDNLGGASADIKTNHDSHDKKAPLRA